METAKQFKHSELIRAKFKAILAPVIAAFDAKVEETILEYIDEIEHMAQPDVAWSEEDYDVVIESLLMGVYIAAAMEAAQYAGLPPVEFIRAVHAMAREAVVPFESAQNGTEQREPSETE